MTREDLIEELKRRLGYRQCTCGGGKPGKYSCGHCVAAGAIAALERRFPIQDGPSVPWSLMLPHEAQCQRNHGQTLERIAQRGGLSSGDAYAVVHGIAWRDIKPEFKAAWREFTEAQAGPTLELELDSPMSDDESLLARVLEFLDVMRDGEPPDARCETLAQELRAAIKAGFGLRDNFGQWPGRARGHSAARARDE